jgi:hypothetical protein
MNKKERMSALYQCPRQNSNLQPFAPQANALSNCATRADFTKRIKYTPLGMNRQAKRLTTQLTRRGSVKPPAKGTKNTKHILI